MVFGCKTVGKIVPKSAKQIVKTRVGLGMEKLDRNLYDPNPCYDEIAALGVKKIRLQSGWCRTEKVKGVYDFLWLDEIVDNLIVRGLEPWFCLCYGNELYTEGACNKYGSVGYPPIKTQAERDAWDNYVKACVSHYKGRVSLYEIWNEPDGYWCWRPESNAREYAEFVVRTAKAIKSADENAKIVAGSFHSSLNFLYDFLREENCAEYIDFITYHRYKYVPDNGVKKYVEGANAVIKEFSDKIKLIQGETGTQSDWSPNGALPKGNWTERKQAKFCLRKLVADLVSDVEFTSFFSAADMYENIFTDSGEKVRSMYGFFGVLGENFDGEKPLGTYYEKEAYKALQNLCSIFCEDYETVDLPVEFTSTYSPFTGRDEDRAQDDFGGIFTYGFKRPNGSKALAYWKCSEILNCEYESTISLTAFGIEGKVRLVDMMTGEVMEIGDKIMKTENGKTVFEHIPVRDYPLLITFGDFADTEEKK